MPPRDACPPPAKPPPAPASPNAGAVYIDDLLIQPAQAAKALKWINSADEATLRASGIYARGVNVILQHRPFATIEAFAATPYIGKKSVEAALNATK